MGSLRFGLRPTQELTHYRNRSSRQCRPLPRRRRIRCLGRCCCCCLWRRYFMALRAWSGCRRRARRSRRSRPTAARTIRTRTGAFSRAPTARANASPTLARGATTARGGNAISLRWMVCPLTARSCAYCDPKRHRLAPRSPFSLPSDLSNNSISRVTSQDLGVMETSALVQMYVPGFAL